MKTDDQSLSMKHSFSLASPVSLVASCAAMMLTLGCSSPSPQEEQASTGSHFLGGGCPEGTTAHRVPGGMAPMTVCRTPEQQQKIDDAKAAQQAAVAKYSEDTYYHNVQANVSRQPNGASSTDEAGYVDYAKQLDDEGMRVQGPTQQPPVEDTPSEGTDVDNRVAQSTPSEDVVEQPQPEPECENDSCP
jgi:hypothetical protein